MESASLIVSDEPVAGRASIETTEDESAAEPPDVRVRHDM
ncbi:unnamed protein product [Gongylonema pulchrum]|uniref:Transcriptional regulator n=1 Tax=Gongylonema pulchrum TaxID=637853 RepID=A0A183DF86_9BILA|nr:unnamed protein product [Gongylonema pulchrum]